MISNFDSTAIASEENLQKNPTIQELLKREADASRQIAQQLADKKQECGKNKRKWQEYLQENGITERDANKRIKLVRLPLVLWQVGTIMALQLVTPMMEPVRDYFTATGDKVTQEAVEAKMDDAKLMRKMERELLAEEEEVSIWKMDKNGRRYWQSGKSYDQEAGVVLEELVKETGKLPQTIISEALLQMVNGGASVSRPSGR
ncbi:hypothetical protein SAMD00079811_45460 [Scytonema sp. HK-05]|uniref:hypothetical protein n=1 Tax=Scytonema sp. HK-05 TaxID=1137095 RepID=UPI000935DC77|nr:hypothetical protein [Scytonema sp. HK-05]OKH58578.1 hypothetical protein NIES2130_13980 [Scytonema sp. HK-05]BAY46930.1 hypothetical protein SAMD00079811_45460 [Scytonema sp. HK-05]